MVLLKKRNSPEVTKSGVENAGRNRAAANAGLSLLLPGLGQLAQRRYVPALLQFGTVAAYVIAAGGAHWGRAMWLAVAWNVWSGIEAWWYDRRNRFETPGDIPPLPEG